MPVATEDKLIKTEKTRSLKGRPKCFKLDLIEPVLVSWPVVVSASYTRNDNNDRYFKSYCHLQMCL